MARQNNSSTPVFRRTFVIAALIVLAAGFTLLVLEKTKVTDFYKKPVSSTTTASDARPVNSVDYNTATTTDSDEAERIKAAAEQQLGAIPTPAGSKIEVSLSAAGQDVKGGPIVVRAMVGTTSGQCKLNLTGAGTPQDFNAEVINLGTYYGCKGFDVPVENLPAGTYQATLTVTNGTSSGSVSQQVEVAK